MTAPGFRIHHDGFRVDADELAARAAQTADLAQRMHRAVATAAPVNPSAFGIIGQSYGTVAATAALLAGAAIGTLADTVDRAATDLRACQDGYTRVEWAATARFARIRS